MVPQHVQACIQLLLFWPADRGVPTVFCKVCRKQHRGAGLKMWVMNVTLQNASQVDWPSHDLTCRHAGACEGSGSMTKYLFRFHNVQYWN